MNQIQTKSGDCYITYWLRKINIAEFLDIRELGDNPNLNYGEFATIINQAGRNRSISSIPVRMIR